MRLRGAIALPAYFGVPLSFPEYRGPLIALEALAMLGGILLMFYAGNTLTPAIIRTLVSEPTETSRFDHLHRRLLATNVITTVIGLSLLIAFANRPAPKTRGIVESGPGDSANVSTQKPEPNRPVSKENPDRAYSSPRRQ